MRCVFHRWYWSFLLLVDLFPPLFLFFSLPLFFFSQSIVCLVSGAGDGVCGVLHNSLLVLNGAMSLSS